MAANFTLEDLELWHLSRRLRQRFSQVAKQFPVNERYRLVDQMIRASRSITANLAEGYGRFHFQESIQYCRQARGSLYELVDHLTVALDEKYIQKAEFDEINAAIQMIARKLNAYINYLVKQKQNHSANQLTN